MTEHTTDGEDRRTELTTDGDRGSTTRRNVLVAAAGATGGGPLLGSRTAAASSDHDHSGDHLGSDEPVASIRARELTVEAFDLPSSFLVFRRGNAWCALRTSTQTVVFEDEDGAAVVNRALETLADENDDDETDGRRNGVVRVTAPPGGVVLESNTTIQHTVSDTALILEDGVTVEYTGDDEAIVAGGGEGSPLYFDTIDANGADYAIREIGTGIAIVEGKTLRGASDTLYFVDLEDRGEFLLTPPGSYVDIRELDCTAHPTPFGLRAESNEGNLSEGYLINIGIIRGPTDTGIKLGREGDQIWDSFSYSVVNAFVDGATNDARRLVEINDRTNRVTLEGYTPATGGDWDVEVNRQSVYSSVGAPTGRRELRVKRNSFLLNDETKHDPISEVTEIELLPDSLEGYEITTVGDGDVSLTDGGLVALSTGELGEDGARLVRRVDPLDAPGLSFDAPAVLQTNVMTPTGATGDALFVWGRRGGPAVGWRLADGLLEGYVHDGTDEKTLTLRSEVDPGDAWNLTAFYNAGTDVWFHVEDVTAETLTLDGDETVRTEQTVRGPEIDEESGSVWIRGWEHQPVGRITSNLPSGAHGADNALFADLEDRIAGAQELWWSDWKLHQYAGVSQ